MDTLKQEQCKACGYTGVPTIKVMETGVHYAKLSCDQCGRFIRWMAKPEGDASKYRRENQHKELAAKFGNGYCELCLIKESDLPNGESMEGHHVIEYADGGDSSRENVWVVCTACHKLIHWRRTYLGHLLDKLSRSVAESMTSWRE